MDARPLAATAQVAPSVTGTCRPFTCELCVESDKQIVNEPYLFALRSASDVEPLESSWTQELSIQLC
jgi:hypothetical protein